MRTIALFFLVFSAGCIFCQEDDEKIHVFVDEEATPVFSLSSWIAQHMVFPSKVVEAGIWGKLSVSFVVEKDGTINHVEVVRGIPDCPECDAEVICMVRQMPPWKPGKHNGKIVRMYITLPITICLM